MRGERAVRQHVMVPVPAHATLSDVAALAGVSLKTASRVFNDHPNVSDGVRQRVQDAAAELGYVPNTIARELRAGAQSNLVGLIIGNLGNPFYSRLAGGAEAVLVEAGLELLVASSGDDAEHERRLVASMLSRRVRGLLVVPSGQDYSFLEADVSRGTSVVFVDRPPNGLHAPSVVVDNRAGVRQAVTHLADHGHRRIALLADHLDLWTARERVEGFRAVCAELGLDDDPQLVITGLSTTEQARRAAADLYLGRRPPTAVLPTNNVIALGAIEAMRRTRTRVALVSFDDFDASELLDVTTLSHEPGEIGAVAARTLLGELHGPARGNVAVVLETGLVLRGSGERAPEAGHAVPSPRTP